MRLAAQQPHYLPYPGLIAKIQRADVFVLQDDLRFIKQGWQNRNRIRASAGWKWLTIPVHAGHDARIMDVMPASPLWHQKHMRVVQSAYRHRASSLSDLWEVASTLSLKPLSEICLGTMSVLLRKFGVTTPIVLESTLMLSPQECMTKEDRLIALCRRLGCNSYLAGSGSSAFLRTDAWTGTGIDLEWLVWKQTPYTQPFDGWIPDLSAIDLYMCHDNPAEAIFNDSRIECASFYNSASNTMKKSG